MQFKGYKPYVYRRGGGGYFLLPIYVKKTKIYVFTMFSIGIWVKITGVGILLIEETPFNNFVK